MKPHFPLVIMGVLALTASACGSGPKPTPTEDPSVVETRVAANVFATQTAAAPTLTDTPAPTRTPVMAVSSRPTTASVSEVVVTTTLKSGWIEYQFKANKFAVALPPSWKGLDLSPDAMDRMLSASGELNPALKNMFSSQQFRSQAAAGIKFFGIDVSPKALETGFPATVNVVREDAGVELPLDSLGSLNLALVKKVAVPDIPITQRRVKLGNMDAVRLAYGMKSTSLIGEPITLALTQYLVVNGKTQYVLTLGCAREVTKTYDPIFEKVAQSFRLLK